MASHAKTATPPEPMLRSPAWTAAALGVSYSTLRRWTASGRMPCVRVGARVYYLDEDIHTFVRDSMSAIDDS